MAVIFNRRVQSSSKGKEGDGAPHLCEWHPSLSLLAVASKDDSREADGAVYIHSEQVRPSKPPQALPTGLPVASCPPRARRVTWRSRAMELHSSAPCRWSAWGGTLAARSWAWAGGVER